MTGHIRRGSFRQFTRLELLDRFAHCQILRRINPDAGCLQNLKSLGATVAGNYSFDIQFDNPLGRLDAGSLSCLQILLVVMQFKSIGFCIDKRKLARPSEACFDR